jgi:hypothetical protein
MLNHMIAWKGWIFPDTGHTAVLAGPKRSEYATFERMVLRAPVLKLVPKPDGRKLH